MTPLFAEKATIYNSIAKTPAEDRHWDRFVINKCQIQSGFVENADGTIRNVVNATTVITKDIEHYKPADDYAKVPVDMRAEFFTVKTGDFVVFGEVTDEVTTAQEYNELQEKYKDKGIRIKSYNAYINGMAVDNVTMSNV